MSRAKSKAGQIGRFVLFADANRRLATKGWQRTMRLAEQDVRRKARLVERQARLNTTQAANRAREAARKRRLDGAQAKRKFQHAVMLKTRNSRWP